MKTRRFIFHLKAWSQFRYFFWRLLESNSPIVLVFNSGLKVYVRGRGHTDLSVCRDIFSRVCYRSSRLDEMNIRTVLDLGANVGYSCLHWLSLFPTAYIKAFEPHPVHADVLQRNLALNAFSDNVEFVEAAAGIEDCQATISDAESSSSVRNQGNGYLVEVHDVFGDLTVPFDLVKIDIEGGEYEILGDERFSNIQAQCLIVEWHGDPGQPWVINKLEAAGYETEIGIQDPPGAGVVWGFRKGLNAINF